MASGKTYDYIVVLKRPDYRLVDLISRLMLIISIAVFGYFIGLVGSYGINRVNVSLSLLIIGMAGWIFYCYRKQKKEPIVYYRLGLLMAAIGWSIISGLGFVTILFIIAVISEKQVKFPQEIAFDENGVVINSLPRKNYIWAQINNVILKDGLLTMDFKNNQLIQKPTESYPSAAEEKDFNEFCLSKLKADA